LKPGEWRPAMSDRVVIITGSRHASDPLPTEQVLLRLSPTRIIQGGQTGVDFMAKGWAHKHAVPYETYPYMGDLGKAGGPVRNKEMVRRGWVYIDKLGDTVIVVAMPGGIGTANMVRLALMAGLFVLQPADVLAGRCEDLWDWASRHYRVTASDAERA
jgi:hypothetical protein